MRIPVHLKHKPVIALENYEKIDGNYPPNETDAKGLSIGLAQWNEQDVLDISAKFGVILARNGSSIRGNAINIEFWILPYLSVTQCNIFLAKILMTKRLLILSPI